LRQSHCRWSDDSSSPSIMCTIDSIKRSLYSQRAQMFVYLCTRDTVTVDYQVGHHYLALHSVHIVLFILVSTSSRHERPKTMSTHTPWWCLVTTSWSVAMHNSDNLTYPFLPQLQETTDNNMTTYSWLIILVLQIPRVMSTT
jgi:hypothetical protein